MIMCDNLRSHKCTEVLKVIQDPNVELLFLSSYSPEFSAIENLFGHLKHQLKDVRFNTKEVLAEIITGLCKKVGQKEIQSFLRLSLKEITSFYYNNR